ncbi:lymphocyte antigen 6A-2/6E-1-like [Cricetulus griseus]|uniref:Lymphocyte antigen 6A-2/6E-1-like n=1 Tax=Cricetulus griseus TaxID=10029 RepID=A0A9J7GS56_CRIGR|nr:lymphocyte antigen 6A-2/6E-1-like [Cricetulus griseus]XP_035317082.1 lymphocyte antigen 6A-2/6E-1-like [Cricetulus griseus]
MNSSHTMNTCVFILLVTLLCAERAQGLLCYQCLGVTSEISETTCPPANCSYPDGVCISQEVETIIDSHKVKTKNKFCVPVCPDKNYDGNFDFLGVQVFTKLSCCNKDLCNAAVPTGGSTWTLAGVLLFSLGSVLLQAL